MPAVRDGRDGDPPPETEPRNDARMAAARAGAKRTKDEADRAVTDVERAVGRLIRLLRADDRAGAAKVIGCLMGFGPAAVDLLAGALEANPEDPLLRPRVVGAVCAFGHVPTLRRPALLALMRARLDEPYAAVNTAIGLASHALGQRPRSWCGCWPGPPATALPRLPTSPP
jgi:hypothetical protein